MGEQDNLYRGQQTDEKSELQHVGASPSPSQVMLSPQWEQVSVPFAQHDSRLPEKGLHVHA